jgi:uncharacterized membrane protein
MIFDLFFGLLILFVIICLIVMFMGMGVMIIKAGIQDGSFLAVLFGVFIIAVVLLVILAGARDYANLGMRRADLQSVQSFVSHTQRIPRVE